MSFLDQDERLIELAEKEVFEIFVYNEIGALGRGAVDQIDNDVLYKETLLLVIQTFDRLRGEIEKSSKIEKERAYKEVYGQVGSLKRWMEIKRKKDTMIEQEIASVLGKFKEIGAYEEKVIKWPTWAESKAPEQGETKKE